MSNDRSIDEFVRLVKAMQMSDEHRVATPRAWQPGDKVIVAPPATAEAAEARVAEGYGCTDWYFCKGTADLLRFPSEPWRARHFQAPKRLKMKESGSRIFVFRLIFGQDGQ